PESVKLRDMSMLLNSVSFFFSSRRRHTRSKRDWSSEVCSSDIERESSEEDNHELIDKNPDGKDRDYSFKKDIDGEQVIRIDDERSEERRVGKEVEISMMGGRMGESRKQSTSDIEKAGAHKCRDT